MSALPNNSLPNDSRDAVAARLAAAHRSADPSICAIYRIEAPGQELNPGEPVKLLEVNPNTTVSGIIPVWFAPHAPSGIVHPSVVVEIHPTEWSDLQSGVLPLPNGWRLAPGAPLWEAR